MVRLQFHAAPESGGRQPQHPSRSKQPLSLCPDPSQCTGTGHEETFSEHFAVEVRRSRWGYLKEFWFSGRCHSAGSSKKSWSVPGSPPRLLKQRERSQKETQPQQGKPDHNEESTKTRDNNNSNQQAPTKRDIVQSDHAPQAGFAQGSSMENSSGVELDIR